ncbi:MAG: adenylate/guanylate cyclase domain-containing protein, partial [Thermus sp.]
AQGLLEEPLPGQEDLEAKARLEATRIRFYLETGQLKKALRHAKGLPSHPWLAAASLPAYALLGLRRPDLAELARAHPDGQGLYLLTQGFLAWHEGEDPLPFFKKALRLGRALPNPYVFHMTASALALYLWRKAPKRAQALSQFLLRQTQKAGFAVHLELARLLRAQLLFEEGQEVAHLLAFTPTIPLTSAWRRRLLGQAGGEPSPAWGYGILGRWVLWLEPSPRGG